MRFHFLLSTRFEDNVCFEAPSQMPALETNHAWDLKALLFHGESDLSIVSSFGAPSVRCACVAARLHPDSGVPTGERLRTDTFPKKLWYFLHAFVCPVSYLKHCRKP